MHNCLEDRHQHRITRSNCDTPVKCRVSLLIVLRIGGYTACLGRLEQLVEIGACCTQSSEACERRLDCHSRLESVDGIGQLGEFAAEIERPDARIADESAPALLAANSALSFQEVESIADRAPAYTKLPCENALWRKSSTRRHVSGVDKCTNLTNGNGIRLCALVGSFGIIGRDRRLKINAQGRHLIRCGLQSDRSVVTSLKCPEQSQSEPIKRLVPASKLTTEPIVLAFEPRIKLQIVMEMRNVHVFRQQRQASPQSRRGP